ncbi:MAG: hypothetical protein JWO86_5170, partial [Myxococcaceae bacterium]|nr:hypothetical protein [Myxococcaceae bacterium]
PLPASTFTDPPPNALDIVGHVHIGTERVAAALVRVDPSPGATVDPLLLAASETNPKFARTVTADAAGAYRLPFNPPVYDLSITHDRDVSVFRHVQSRAFDPLVAGEPPVTGFRARVLPSTNPPAPAGHATAYIVSGDEARTIAAVAGTSGAFDAVFRHFDATITLHAIEYVAAQGPGAAVAEGKLDVHVRDGVVVAPIITMTPITLVSKATFEVTPPSGYVLAPLVLEMDFGVRTSAVPLPLTRVVPGETLKFAVATDARYFVHARATQGGAVSDSGRFFINPFDRNALTLPPPVSSEAPIDDQATAMDAGTTATPPVLALGGTLSARLTKGIVEHALLPENGTGTIVHVVTGDRATTLPDASALVLPPPSGRYLWTIQSFPTLPFTDRLNFEDGRVSPPSWTSAPRVLVVQ